MSTKRVKEEHQKCRKAMQTLMQEGRDSGCNGPYPKRKHSICACQSSKTYSNGVIVHCCKRVSWSARLVLKR